MAMIISTWKEGLGTLGARIPGCLTLVSYTSSENGGYCAAFVSLVTTGAAFVSLVTTGAIWVLESNLHW